jgi:ATP/maltotriose-dependent transcriptional regulator MalT
MGQGLMAGEPGRGADVVGGVLAGVPEASDQLRGLYASLLAFDSRLTEALAVSTPLIEDSDVLPLTRTFAGVAAVGAEYWLGHSRRAVSLADAISPIAMTVRAALPYGAASLELIAVCALLDEGELDRARERAERLREQATDDHDPFAGPRAEYCLGRVDLVRGRAATAARRFRRTLAALSPFDQSFRRHISSMLALAAAALGDVATARTTLDACADAPRMKTYEPEFELAVAAILAAELRMGDAADHAAWAAGTAADCGQWNIAVAGYHRAACYGAARGILLQMRDAVPRVDGNFAWTLLDHVSAHAARDAAALDEVGRRFEVHGATLLAAQASAEAALAHASDGHPRRARASAVHSAPLRDRCEGAGFPWLAWSEIAAPLTARERQVAVLAAGDQPDAHIAERLGISVRTVQTHLARVYAKLGITSRAQIAAHLDF